MIAMNRLSKNGNAGASILILNNRRELDMHDTLIYLRSISVSSTRQTHVILTSADWQSNNAPILGATGSKVLFIELNEDIDENTGLDSLEPESTSTTRKRDRSLRVSHRCCNDLKLHVGNSLTHRSTSL
jgi:hypothetical protein